MPTVTDLQGARQKARKKERRVEDAITNERTEIEALHDVVKEERGDILQLQARRKELKLDLEVEIEKDPFGKGIHGEQWERWAEGRRDEIADLIDGAEARIDRSLEFVLESKGDIARFKDRESDLNDRIVRLGKKIERKREDKDGQLSTHFHVVEFDCHDGTPVPEASYEALAKACNDYLEPLRAKYGVVHINSGFRTLTYNASIGGASMSVHVYNATWQHSPWACAIDHVSAGLAPSGVQAFHERETHPDGMGRYSVFTHVDNRNRIGWADSRWAGP